MDYRHIMRVIVADALPSCGEVGTEIAKAALGHPEKVDIEMSNGYAGITAPSTLFDPYDAGLTLWTLHLEYDGVSSAWRQTGISLREVDRP